MRPRAIASRDNPLLVRLRRLAQTPAAYRRLGQIWVEGDHLGRAALARGVPLALAIGTEAAWADPDLAPLLGAAREGVVVPAPLLAACSTLASPAPLGFVLDLPAPAAPAQGVSSVVLDGVQDAGNVGSVLRSAAALGVKQVLALASTAALWSPKVLRAGMGAHFGLRLVESLVPEDLDALGVPLLATSPHAGIALPEAELPAPCAWVFGHEGQGVTPEVSQRCALTLRIPQPGGEESLGVAAAAAICLYESARRAHARR
ncbi:MAG TPA: RNA methyltransferase [Rubrivivax sp.]|nr:RNA methyltransferase [Rubrivivax sp.]